MTRTLAELLDLVVVGTDAFEAPTPADGLERLFGGQVASQSLRAATLTVDAERPPHSLHAYFLRPGRAGVPLRLEVDRVRDGRSFATRVVTARQDGEAILTMTASFHAPERGQEWDPGEMPSVPEPDAVDPMPQLTSYSTTDPVDIRPVIRVQRGRFPVLHPYWARVREQLPDDPALHACAMTFISDFGVIASARAPAGAPIERLTGASLDHALWFHRPARADEWLLYDVKSATNSRARALARGAMWTQAGTHVMSVAQEALLRETGREPRPE